MFGTRMQHWGVAMAVVVGIGAFGSSLADLADVGIDADATASIVDGVSRLSYSGMVDGVVWRLEVDRGGSNADLVARLFRQLDAAGCDDVASIHGHGRAIDGRGETTTTAMHLSCPAADVEVGWTTGQSVVWVVVGEAR